MKLWLSKNSEIPLREQLVRQIMAAVSSGDLQTGDKLPSVRELALRFKIHQNTVSAAYQWLEENGWVQSRQGSGVFVKRSEKEKHHLAELNGELDTMISQFFRQAQNAGYSKAEIQTGLEKYLSNPKPEFILIVEKDDYLRQIILTELQAAINFPISAFAPEQFTDSINVSNAIIAAMPETIAGLLINAPNNSQVISLKINSVQGGIKGQTKPEDHELIGIVSGWERFLRWAKTFLIAVGIDAETILIRNLNEKDDFKGLEVCLFVITDSATAQNLPKQLDLRIFRLIADDSIEQLKTLIQ